jgi:hypoxanthine-DNA glycosylase
MKELYMMKSEQKLYSLEPIIDSRAKVLILGSMPGEQSLAKQQYYGNPKNHFWKIIFSLIKEEIPQDYQEKITILQKHKLALWDSIHSCERPGSLDSSIRSEEPNDFHRLLKQYSKIKLIAFNGGKSFDVFKKHIGFDSFSGIDFKKLPSTSPTPGKNVKTLEGKLIDWSIIKNYI